MLSCQMGMIALGTPEDCCEESVRYCTRSVSQEPGTGGQPASSSDCFPQCSCPAGDELIVMYGTPGLGQALGTLRRKPLTAWAEATFSWGLSGNVFTVFESRQDEHIIFL